MIIFSFVRNMSSSFNLITKVREFETKMIKTALLKTNDNQFRAAKLLGVKPTTLYNEIKFVNVIYFKNTAN